MANLTPNPSWDSVYQKEVTDDVIGGPGGISNRAEGELLNRTSYNNESIEHIRKFYASEPICKVVTHPSSPNGNPVTFFESNFAPSQSTFAVTDDMILSACYGVKQKTRNTDAGNSIVQVCENILIKTTGLNTVNLTSDGQYTAAVVVDPSNNSVTFRMVETNKVFIEPLEPTASTDDTLWWDIFKGYMKASDSNGDFTLFAVPLGSVDFEVGVNATERWMRPLEDYYSRTQFTGTIIESVIDDLELYSGNYYLCDGRTLSSDNDSELKKFLQSAFGVNALPNIAAKSVGSGTIYTYIKR